jgi:N-acetylmuramoyl-L-alanine amidase
LEKLIKLLLILSLLFSSLYGLNSKYYQEKFNTTKKLYLGAVMSSDKTKEIQYLKKLIHYGDKLEMNTIKYKRELKRLDKSVIVTNPTHKIKSPTKYNIRSIYETSNTIVINFTRDIDSSFLNFYEKKEKGVYKDYFDIKGNYKYINTKKININLVDKVTLSQVKKDKLRITIDHSQNPKTLYIIDKNKIIIKIFKSSVKKTAPKKVVKKQEVKIIKPTPKKKAPFLDKKYTIKSVEHIENAIVINFTHKVNKSHINFYEEKKGGYYIDGFFIKGNFKGAKEKKIKIPSITKTTVLQYNKSKLRITLKNRKNPKTIYIIGRNKIIIKILDAKKSKTVKKEDFISPYDKTIVIDAGHGGKDPGAKYGRRYEKNIVLNIAKFLRKELVNRGFKVYLTRSRDKYVKLPNRTKYANKKKADMFISIHANAARKSRAKKASGVETYFLSPARSARAKRVAALENKGDIKKMGWSSKNSLLTILNQSKITASNKMAIDVQRNMLYILRQKYGKKTIVDGGVREGPFWVLVGAQMPSILVEIGYISHPSEGRRINTRSYQEITAVGIANGIERYFIKN